MPETPPPPALRKLLLIPEGTNAEEIRDRAAQALSNLPVQKMELGELTSSGGMPVRQLTIEVAGDDNAQHRMALRAAVDLALKSGDLTQYSMAGIVMGAKA